MHSRTLAQSAPVSYRWTLGYGSVVVGPIPSTYTGSNGGGAYRNPQARIAMRPQFRMQARVAVTFLPSRRFQSKKSSWRCQNLTDTFHAEVRQFRFLWSLREPPRGRRSECQHHRNAFRHTNRLRE